MPIRKVIHIDDDEDDQEIFRMALGRIPCEAEYLAFTNPAEALQKIVDRSVQPHIIFLDMNMPEMDGEQFLRALYTRFSPEELPVIVLSTSAHQPTMQTMIHLGARDFITKPDTLAELRNKLLPLLA